MKIRIGQVVCLMVIGQFAKKLVVYDDEAEVIRMMFQKYADGWGTLKIATHLNRQGVKDNHWKVLA